MACVFAGSLPANAQTDLFGAMKNIDRELADAPGLPRSGFACPQPEPGKPLIPEGTLLDLPSTLDRALCANPRVREAWAIARFRAAQVGGAKAADMPTLSLSGQLNLRTAVEPAPAPFSSTLART
jgi:outer membrane protein TolC